MQAHPAEYDTDWRAAVDVYRGYAARKKRTGNRHIPIMVLMPQ